MRLGLDLEISSKNYLVNIYQSLRPGLNLKARCVQRLFQHFIPKMRLGPLPVLGICAIYSLSAICIVSLVLTFFPSVKRTCLACIPCRHARRGRLRRNARRRRLPDENDLDEPTSHMQSSGLASAVIHSLPAIQFREEITKGGDQGNTDCAVCLGEFTEGEWLRLLPNCAHVFHVACIDTWFVSHSTCPLCRTDVLYDFTSCDASVSVVALLETLRREETSQERPLGHRLLDAVTMRNPEFRLGAISSRLFETDSDESPAFSPAIGPNNMSAQVISPEPHPTHAYKGGSSRSPLTILLDGQLPAHR